MSSLARAGPSDPLTPPAPPPRVLGSGFLNLVLVTIGVNTLIALVVTLVQSTVFDATLRVAQLVGLSILLWVVGLRRLAKEPSRRHTIIGLALGVLTGLGLNRLWAGSLNRTLVSSPHHLFWVTLAIALTFGVAVTYYFRSITALAEGRAHLHQERARRAEDAHRLVEAELKLLQAQIEPHFLFNTLSTIVQLVTENPEGARKMLLDLTNYLRGSLRRTRAGATSLGEELELVRAYLDIQSVRMGARLTYAIDCPADLQDVALPPLLLQPLVENSLRHGIEPSRSGGSVRVNASRHDDTLVLDVEDTGMGLSSGTGSGVGLSNVHARVRAVSKGLGTMVIQPNTPTGLRIRIELPIAPLRPKGAT
jgi:hypothetical protein